MKTQWSSKWKASSQPRKQRKYRYNAPLHIKGSFLGCHLSKELKTKYGKRALRVVKGDKVKIIRGSFKGQSGKVERVDIKTNNIFITKIEVIKKDGTKRTVPLKASNLIIQELNLDDRSRLGKGSEKREAKPVKAEKKVAKKAPEPKKEETKVQKKVDSNG